MSKAIHARHFSKRASPAPGCTTGAFFKSPKAGDSIDTSVPLDITWDTSLNCISTAGVDIYLYSPFSRQTVIHAWTAVAYSPGSFKTDLAGSWWNSTSGPISLQLGVVESGKPSFMSPIPTGPLFTATFNATDYGLKHPTGASTPGKTQGDAEGGGIFQVIGNAYRNSGLPKGSIAAAVLVPILAVALAIAVYIKIQRRKEAENRRRWSQAVDKRMSTISSDWKGLPANAQSEAIRQSIAIMRDSRSSIARMSQLYDARPVSIPDAGNAGVGVGGTAHKAPGVGPRNPDAGSAQLSQRKSTVSFAANTQFSRPSTDTVQTKPAPRPSNETQRGRASRAFHVAITAEDPADMLSPTQVGGPTMLGERDIHRQLELDQDANVAPALTMMKHGGGDFLQLDHSPITSSPLTPPSAAHLMPTNAMPFHATTTPPNPAYGSPQTSAPMGRNPFEGFMKGPSNMLSPDAMLRAYAARDGVHGTPMAVGKSNGASSPRVYPAFDAPAQPAPVRNDPAPVSSQTRMLYAPGQVRAVSEVSRYSASEDDAAAYGGLGQAS